MTELEVARILLDYRERVAQATADALDALRAAGVRDPVAVLLRPPAGTLGRGAR